MVTDIIASAYSKHGFVLRARSKKPTLRRSSGTLLLSMKQSRSEADAISGASSRKTSRFGNLGCALFSLPFLFAGAALIYFLGVTPLVRVLRASSWNATPCVVTSSRVASSSDGDTFSVEIHYSYSVEGRQYDGKRYGFFGGSSSGYASKKEVVDLNPVGKNATCYVNPFDPAEAVFHRGFTWDMLWGLFGLPFFAVGAGGLFMSLRTSLKERRTRKEARANPAAWPSFNAMHSPASLSTTQGGGAFQPISSHQPSSYQPSSRVEPAAVPFGRAVLEPATTPARKLIVVTLIALVWNGIVSVFVGVVISEWGRGGIEWIMMLFLTPFVLIGLLLLFGVAHTFLAMFNPRPRLTIGSRRLKPGESSELDWQFSGSTSRVSRLRIYLEGREEATYRQGTDTKTDKNVFATIEIADRPGAGPGRATVEIPGDTMHSFKSEHNKIVWEIRVQGDIRYWSDVDETFEIEVLPRAPGIAEP